MRKSKRPRVTNSELRGELESVLRTFFEPLSEDLVPTDHEIQRLEGDLMDVCTIQLARSDGR